MDSRRAVAFALLALASLLWSGNWILGRALREAFDPVSLNFWRWLVAVLAIAPFALGEAWKKRALVRRHAGLLLLLALSGVAAFQTLVYLGLESTTAINAVLINAAGPLFMVACSWLLDRHRTTVKQVAGMLISLAGIIVIVCQGDAGRLLTLEFHRGDGWILLAMPLWGLYSVLLKRCPRELGGLAFIFVVGALGVAMLAPFFAVEALRAPVGWPAPAHVASILYVALAASVAAFLCWNRGVAIVGANAAGFTLPLLPAFGTLLAMVFLGETFRLYHAAGISTILAGVILATRRAA